ncbi:restriction endonuclease subunit S [Microcoleus sp. BROC3]|uniref:restriction endonuclease subunit S n=1 Tax=Microcoleus sp. BROC3 TaxID=3055323 RepID=UPI002FD20FDE
MTTWPLVALGDIFEIARGGSPRPIQNYITDDVDGVNWIMIADASESSKYITSTKKRIRKEGVKNSRMVYPGDFVLTNSMSFGRPYIMKTSGCIHDGWLVLSNRLENVDSNYFFHLLGSNAVYLEFARRAAGATVKNLNIDLVKGVQIPLPPLEEQKRIAEILDRAEELRSKRREAIAQLDTLTQAIFLEMFGDPITNPKGLSIKPLEDYLLFITSGGRGWAKFYAPSGSRFLRSLDVQMNCISKDDLTFVSPPNNAEARRTQVKTGDVLLTITGSRIGRAAPVLNELHGAYISQHVAILRSDPKKISPLFLSFFLNFETGGQRQIAKVQYGQTKPGLNFDQIKNFQVPIPSIDLQQEFADRVEAVEKLKAAHRASLSQLDALFASLQHRAFRGEL